jgi:tRNA-2-methylthio-N6-dimethylallyladenosine synthase
VNEAAKEERLQRLQELIREQAAAFNKGTIGRKLNVLFAREGKQQGQALGYSPYVQSVHVEDGAHLMGRMAEVEIVGATTASLAGRVGPALQEAPLQEATA